jgi:hypothetical protein
MSKKGRIATGRNNVNKWGGRGISFGLSLLYEFSIQKLLQVGRSKYNLIMLGFMLV